MHTQRIRTPDRSKGYRLPIVFRITVRTFIYSNWILIWVSINATHAGSVVRNYRYRVFECSSECRASGRKKILGCRRFARTINVMFSVVENRYITDLRHEPYEFSDASRRRSDLSNADESRPLYPIFGIRSVWKYFSAELANLSISWDRWDWERYTIFSVFPLHSFYSLLFFSFCRLLRYYLFSKHSMNFDYKPLYRDILRKW